MEPTTGNNSIECPSPDISAYLDGELSSADELALDMHIGDCRVCREDLNLQKSFLNALESSIDDGGAIDLPANFTKTVVANAESRVSGLRRPSERRNAALICIALVGVALVLLRGNTENAVTASTSIAEKGLIVLSAVAHFIYDISLGSIVVFKTLAASLVFESGVRIGFIVIVFVLSLYSISRLWGRFDRT